MIRYGNRQYNNIFVSSNNIQSFKVLIYREMCVKMRDVDHFIFY